MKYVLVRKIMAIILESGLDVCLPDNLILPPPSVTNTYVTICKCGSRKQSKKVVDLDIFF